MTDNPPFSATEELGYFYDAIHGRIALDELPREFYPALKSALSSPSLARLKRISQLGHTSVSFFSATHTRFSHAVGTMLVMNKLFHHIISVKGLPVPLFDDLAEHYPDAVAYFGTREMMLHCHLLLVALYQDAGELPFQKVASLHFEPHESDLERLHVKFSAATPRQWTTKQVFSVRCLVEDFKDSLLKQGFTGYDLAFLVYLITGAGTPANSVALPALLQMVDGVVDADRLDYVYRDALATIGSLASPSTVLESVVAYESGRVVVDDPQPVTDFLATRMRLWTFVYNSSDVRFRQTLLRTVLEGYWESQWAQDRFRDAFLTPELTQPRFMELDDKSLMDRVAELKVDQLKEYRQEAKKLLLGPISDYDCRIFKRGVCSSKEDDPARLPGDLFFDLLSDHGHHHQLYRPKSVCVRQGLTDRIDKSLPLEECAGAFSPIFSATNSAMLVPGGYFLFVPRDHSASGLELDKALHQEDLFSRVTWEDGRRTFTCPTDTRQTFQNTKAISISYCSKDFPTVVRLVRELHRLKRRYWLFLRPFDGTGDTPGARSEQLISQAEAVLAVVSTDYLERACKNDGYVSIEVRAMHDRAKNIPIVPVGLDARDKLDAVRNWNWGVMNEKWRKEQPVLSNEFPLRDARADIVRHALKRAVDDIELWKG